MMGHGFCKIYVSNILSTEDEIKKIIITIIVDMTVRCIYIFDVFRRNYFQQVR